MDRYDLIVIGSGPGGYRAAVLGALRGLKVAIIERRDWGGCCLNRGCVPKKAWHHSAKWIAQSRALASRGLRAKVTADLGVAWEHQREVVATVRDSYESYMKRLGITALRGHGRLLDAQRVELSAGDTVQTIEGAHIILATGSSPRLPSWSGEVPGRVLTTDTLFDEPPPAGKRVALIGSGVIGTEFAFILTLLGKEVVWICGGEPLARSLFSNQARRTLREAMANYDIAPRTGARVQSARVGDDGVALTLEDGGEETVDWVCLGTGRVPHTEGLGLEAAGIETDAAGFVVRNAHLQTAAANVYAIGDCTSPAMTANQALADATLAIDNILGDTPRAQDPLWVPEAIYSAVEMARIGMDEDTAEDEDLEPAVGFAAFETSPRALGQGDTAGFVRLLGDMDSGALLGGEIVGSEAAELIHLLALAPDRDTALRWLARGAYNHPTRAEELLNAAETMASKWGLRDHIFG
ncbi:NAD(P)/FAD-dependent oxidoreductase [Ectothiorhodospiraceae bacterium 2226]|nr:NAD(P)/FAD-dependent oxidoreductase [Ectothiorhodospiraceae bacterium 2226]